MFNFAKYATLTALGLFMFAAVGCSKPGVDPAVIAAHQARLTLTEDPGGAQTVSDVRNLLLHDHDGDGKPDHGPGEHEDHDADDHDDHAHADHDDHDHDGDGHQDHDAEDHDDHAHADHDDHDHDGDGHEDHDADDHDDHAHDDHDHDGDGHQDHAHDAHDDHAHDDHEGHDHGAPAQATEPQDVTVVGHIGGGLTNPWAGSTAEFPFAKNEATFFLADPEAVIENEASGHKHAPGEECAFCAKNAASTKEKLAIVQFVDEKGEVLKIGTQKLFEIEENDMVVIQGKAHITAGGIFVIKATGIYPRK